MSCSEISNSYDGITHDYTRKKGLVWSHVYLPDNAPKEWQDRSALWNAVEMAEKSKDSRLARELIVALPIELAPEAHIWLLEDFIKSECVSKGMCADVCYHNTDGGNPHAHIMLTVRPLDKNGKWQPKTQKEYLCVRHGVEKGFTAAEYKQAEKEGWEKQYLYKIGDEKMYLPPSRAVGLERLNKYPKATQYGRQNPVYEQWNSEEQLMMFRKAWERFVNRELDTCELDARIDHRSYRERGINQVPTIHEGVSPEKKHVSTIVAIRRRRNAFIREHNQLVNDLVEATKMLFKLVGLLISKVADGLESLRVDMLCLSYKASKTNDTLHGCEKRANEQKKNLSRYKSVIKQLSEKTAERDTVGSTLKRTPKIFAFKRKELETEIFRLSEETSELQSEKKRLEGYMLCSDDNAILEVEDSINLLENRISELKPQSDKLGSNMQEKLIEYKQLEADNASLDQDKLREVREHLRPVKEDEAAERIRKELGSCYKDDFFDAQVEVAKLIGEQPPKPPERESYEEAENRRIAEILDRYHADRERRGQASKGKSRDDDAR